MQLKTIKRIRIRSKFERLNVLLLSFEHEEANKIALVTFADAQIDVEAGAPLLSFNSFVIFNIKFVVLKHNCVFDRTFP